MSEFRELISLNRTGRLPDGPTSKFYRALVPKTFKENLAWRRKIYEWGYDNEGFARDVWIMCSRDILFYVNTFAFTLNPKEHGKKPLRPFTTYPYQDEFILLLQDCIGVEDIAAPKTRDMGATWCCLFAMEHRWHFFPDQHFLLTSEKEELVDGRGHKSLFAKLDQFHENQPAWLLPARTRMVKHLKNEDAGSSFDGEATVANMGTGDRRTAIMLDEASKMPGADKIATATRDVTRCRIFNSTPNGRFGQGSGFFQRVQNPHTKKFFMHWTEHPAKVKGLYRVTNGVRELLNPGTYDWREDYDFKQLQFISKVRSPWYDEQCDREHGNPKAIAQELDLDFLGSSEKFIDPAIIASARMNCRAPTHEGRVVVDEEDGELSWHPTGDGPFKVYVPLAMEADNEGRRIERPPLDEYAAGIDIGGGGGGAYTSNSTLVIFNRRTGEQAASFASNSIYPPQFAVYCVAACRWFHDAFMVPEVNGPTGSSWLKMFRELNYSNCYRRDRVQVDGMSNEKAKRWGYHNSDKGMSALDMLQFGLRTRRCTIFDEAILDELLEYEWDSSSPGKIVHAGSKASDSASDKGLAHGDRAIAAAMAFVGIKDRPVTNDGKAVKVRAMPGTFAYRKMGRERAEKARSVSDFSW